MILIVILMLIVIIAALAVVNIRSLILSVIALAVAGLAISLVFLALGARELAAVQLVLEVLLFTALIRATTAAEEAKTFEWKRAISILVVALSLAVFAAAALVSFGALGTPGTSNVKVTSAFMGLNPLAAVAAIFAAVIGALAILRAEPDKEKGEEDGPVI